MLTLHAVAGNLFQINNLQLQLESTFLVDSFTELTRMEMKNGRTELANKACLYWQYLLFANQFHLFAAPCQTPMHLLVVLSFVL